MSVVRANQDQAVEGEAGSSFNAPAERLTLFRTRTFLFSPCGFQLEAAHSWSVDALLLRPAAGVTASSTSSHRAVSTAVEPQLEDDASGSPAWLE